MKRYPSIPYLFINIGFVLFVGFSYNLYYISTEDNYRHLPYRYNSELVISNDQNPGLYHLAYSFYQYHSTENPNDYHPLRFLFEDYIRHFNIIIKLKLDLFVVSKFRNPIHIKLRDMTHKKMLNSIH